MSFVLRRRSAHKLCGPFTRLPVRGEHLGDRSRVRFRRGSEHSFNCIWDTSKWDAPVKERFDSHLVGGVERDAVGPTLFCSLERQAQAREALEVRFLEVEVAQRGQIKREAGSRPLR